MEVVQSERQGEHVRVDEDINATEIDLAEVGDDLYVVESQPDFEDLVDRCEGLVDEKRRGWVLGGEHQLQVGLRKES